MDKINVTSFTEQLESIINSKRDEQKHSVKNEWYDKAAQIEHEIEGLRKAIFLANSGDFHVE